jgi:hypothetical protein
LFEDQFAMTAAADRAVDHNESRPEVQELQNFPDEDRTMYGRARIAGRRRIGHCFWRKMFDWDGSVTKRERRIGQASLKTGRIRPEGFGPEKDSGESCGRDRRMKALLCDFQNSENPKK